MFNDLWEGLKKYTLVRITVAYLMIGWVIMQILEVMGPALRLPEWTLTAAAYILIVGLPVVLLITWSLEHKRKQSEVAEAASGRVGARDKYDVFLFGGAAVVVILIGLRWAMPTEDISGSETLPEQALVAQTPVANEVATVSAEQTEVQKVDEKSIAVLPFADLSQDNDQEYFSDGITEEIIADLSRIRGLKVTSRTSSFAFKGKNDDLKTIGNVLNVAHILEGSVRKQNQQLRITAQLIEVDTGYHIWSQNYDRPLADIFSVQEEIADAITERLELILTDVNHHKVESDVQVSSGVIENYMHARHLLSNPGPDNVKRAIEYLEEAVKEEPDFAKGYAALSQAYITSLLAGGDYEQKQLAAELNALRALELNPQFAEAHAARGWLKVQQRQYSQMEEHFEKAFMINPDASLALSWAAYGQLSVGKQEKAAELFRRATELDPVEPVYYFFLATALMMAGELDEAEKIAKQARAFGFLPANMPLADIAYLRGDREKAVKLATPAVRMIAREFSAEEAATIIEGVYLGGEKRTEAIRLIKETLDREGNTSIIFFPNFLLLLGEYQYAFKLFETNRFSFDQPFYVALWATAGEEARQHPYFPEFVKNIGLVEYWQEYGWPTYCEVDEDQSTQELKFTC